MQAPHVRALEPPTAGSELFDEPQEIVGLGRRDKFWQSKPNSVQQLREHFRAVIALPLVAGPSSSSAHEQIG